MQIKRLKGDFTVCKVVDFKGVNLEAEYCFTGKTDEERSLVCLTGDVSEDVIQREDGWRAFRVEGILDFSLTGILAEISALLTEERIPLFAVSTFNTDYILIKKEKERDALDKLKKAGYEMLNEE